MSRNTLLILSLFTALILAGCGKSQQGTSTTAAPTTTAPAETTYN